MGHISHIPEDAFSAKKKIAIFDQNFGSVPLNCVSQVLNKYKCECVIQSLYDCLHNKYNCKCVIQSWYDCLHAHAHVGLKHVFNTGINI